MDNNRRYLAIVTLFLLLLVLQGCDPLSRHKVLSTIFDGVPSMPPAEQYCGEYAEQRVADYKAELSMKVKATETSVLSEHEPYREKRCDDCHDKTKEDGLVKPKKQVCFVCHTNFLTGEFQHGPAAVGECLVCHEPHSAKFPKLIKKGGNELCEACHLEKRTAAELHARVRGLGMACADCHNPHSANSKFFLR